MGWLFGSKNSEYIHLNDKIYMKDNGLYVEYGDICHPGMLFRTMEDFLLINCIGCKDRKQYLAEYLVDWKLASHYEKMIISLFKRMLREKVEAKKKRKIREKIRQQEIRNKLKLIKK